MRCWVRGVGRIRVPCRHEVDGPGRCVGHGVDGVIAGGVFCGPVARRRAFRGPPGSSFLADSKALSETMLDSPDVEDTTGGATIRSRQWLFILGGAVALLLLVLLLLGSADMVAVATNSRSVGLASFANNWLVTLFKVNLPADRVTAEALAVFNLLDLGIMIIFVVFSIPLYMALKQVSRTWSLVLVALPLLGIPLFAATGTAGRSALLVSGLISAILQARSPAFGPATAATGIAACAVLFVGGDIATAIFGSSRVVAALLAIGYVVWEVWFLLTALGLIRMGRDLRTAD